MWGHSSFTGRGSHGSRQICQSVPETVAHGRPVAPPARAPSAESVRSVSRATGATSPHLNLTHDWWSARRAVVVCGTILGVLFAHGSARAHAGPPFPIVSSRTAGSYDVSVWTDPDSTDDGSAGGQFWVTVRPSGGAVPLPADTRVNVAIRPLDRSGPTNTGSAETVATDASHRFVALVMDHEGRFHVRVTINGPLGPAEVDAEVDATYDLRPPPALIAVYLIPFVLVGFLWIKLLLRRAPAARARREAAERERAGVGPREH
jgi:hypothetical protein